MTRIGIIGFGMVGKAIEFGFGLTHEVKIYDPKYPELDTIKDVVETSDYIFVSVPTPMKKNGEINLKTLSAVIDNLAKTIPITRHPVIIIKSTIIPGTTRRYQQKYSYLKFVFNPEFLTERNHKLDFINTARIILGGEKEIVNKIEKEVYRPRFEHTPIFKTDWETAEFVKYMCNTFFANKVIFMNVIRKAVDKFNESNLGANIDWDMAVKCFLADQRIGNSHYQVPGHDGDFGFGGTCFPKDLNAFIWWLKDQGLKDEANYFKSVWKLNLKYRKNKDWEK